MLTEYVAGGVHQLSVHLRVQTSLPHMHTKQVCKLSSYRKEHSPPYCLQPHFPFAAGTYGI